MLTREQKAEAIRRFKNGESYGRIAASFGVTRNVIGSHINRSGTVRDGNTGARFMNRTASKKYRAKDGNANQNVILNAIKKAEKKAASPEPEIVGPIGDFPAMGCCRFLKADVSKNFQMCGQPTENIGKQYCDWHLDNVIHNRQPATIAA